MPLDLLYVIADDLLCATADCLTDAGLEAPERRFVETCSVSAPVGFGPDECTSQLTVTVGPLRPMALRTSTTAPKQPCALVWMAAFEIMVLRCHPIVGPDPDPADVNAEAKAHLEEGWQIARCLTWRWHAGTLLPTYGCECDSVIWGAVSCIGPQGLIRGWRVSVEIQVADRPAYVPGEPS